MINVHLSVQSVVGFEGFKADLHKPNLNRFIFNVLKLFMHLFRNGLLLSAKDIRSAVPSLKNGQFGFASDESSTEIIV